MPLTPLLLAVGFVFLLKGGDWLVEGSSAIAQRLKVSQLIIGLTVVAFGTSAPELLVNIFASARGSTDLAIGNVLGSNISNIFLILGIAAIIYPLHIKRSTITKEIPLSILAVLAVGFLANDRLLNNDGVSVLSRGDGLTLLSFFAIFMYYAFATARRDRNNSIAHSLIPEKKIKKTGLAKAVAAVLFGTASLVLGGKLIVDSGIDIALALGISESMIGLTVIAIGTSLPELAATAAAAWKKKSDLAVGNVVGSNIFNLFWILGISATIRPIAYSPASNFDLLIVLMASFLLFLTVFTGKRRLIEGWNGLISLVLYFAYLTYTVIRG